MGGSVELIWPPAHLCGMDFEGGYKNQTKSNRMLLFGVIAPPQRSPRLEYHPSTHFPCATRKHIVPPCGAEAEGL